MAGNGPPLLFLHGWTMDGSIFANQFERLKDRFQCLAPDLPGHGENAHLPATLDDGAKHLRSLIETRHIEDAVIIGWSMGAAIAWTYLKRFGAKSIAGLITVDMSPKIVNTGSWSYGLKGQTSESIANNTERFRHNWRSSAESIAAGMFADRSGPPDFDFDRAVQAIRKTISGPMNRMWIDLVLMDLRRSISKIECPYFVVHGARSRVYRPETADWFTEQAPNIRKKLFLHSGHSPHLEEPDDFADFVAEFALSL